MTRVSFFRLFAAACLPVFMFMLSGSAHAEKAASTGAAYIRLENGWEGYWPHGGEFVEYTAGGDAQLSDAYHVMLRPGLGMMLTFADKKNLGAGKNLLEAHREWELAYWRKQVGALDSKNRDDLAGARKDLMVTEINLPQEGGTPLKVYMIGVAAAQGVFVFSISPITAEDDDMIRKLIDSIKVVHHKLDLKAEAKKISPEPGKQQ